MIRLCLLLPLIAAGSLMSAAGTPAAALEFQRLALDEAFRAEGAVLADVTGDGVADAIAGPFYYVGPDYSARHEIYPAQAFDPLQYSDNFVAAAHDFSGDGALDVLVIGFPGRTTAWYENPRADGVPWRRHLAFEGLGNESPTLVDLTGDGRPELVGVHAGRFGYATWNPAAPTEPWTFHPVTPLGDWSHFTHGLGIGDVDGDGRRDLLERGGWWRQPADPTDAPWEHFAVNFGDGGAQMLVHDFNGDGLADVVTSRQAHGYGLSWFEQRRDGDTRTFVEHPITSADESERRNGVQFSQPHALVLADLDGDGAMDFVTGKRWWAHGPHSDPDANGPAVLYGFLWRRGPNGTGRFEPHLIDDASGVGTQVDARDVNGDGRAEVLTSNKRGTHLFVSVTR